MHAPLAIATGRLQLRWLEAGDAEFILQLLNDPAWLHYIGDKGVTTLGQARAYIDSGPTAMYRAYGYGLNRVSLRDGDRPIGICGLVRRQNLDCPDIGFALLPGFRRHGYALEAARAVLADARDEHALRRIAAIVRPDNRASSRLLSKLGFVFERRYRADADGPDLDLYTLES